MLIWLILRKWVSFASCSFNVMFSNQKLLETLSLIVRAINSNRQDLAYECSRYIGTYSILPELGFIGRNVLTVRP